MYKIMIDVTEDIKNDISQLNKANKLNGNPVISIKNANILKNDIEEFANKLKISNEFHYNQLLEIEKNICSLLKINGVYTGNCIVKNYYIGALEIIIEFVDHNMGPKDDNVSDINIFLSYYWDDQKTASKIDTDLTNRGLTVKRDIRDIGKWNSIREFMQSIRNQDFAVFIISDSFLRSTNCMFEVNQMMKEQQYTNRIFPVVLEHNIYSIAARVSYIEYWESQESDLKEKIQNLDLANCSEVTIELKRIREISLSIGEFMSTIADMNNPSESDVDNAIINKLIEKGIMI